MRKATMRETTARKGTVRETTVQTDMAAWMDPGVKTSAAGSRAARFGRRLKRRGHEQQHGNGTQRRRRDTRHGTSPTCTPHLAEV